jgi:serine phosphatase RsbU (regulator of sigma subunit)
MLTLRADVMATAVVASIEHHTTDSESHAAPWWQVCWSNAGHPPPMAISPSGVVETLEASTPNLLLGVTANAERTTTSVALTAGTTLFFCTDGLVERRDQPVKEGMARLATALADLAGRDLEGLCDAVLEEMLTANPEDDVAVVAVRLGGTSS